MKVKVTNKLGLPQAVVEAVSNDPYDPGASTDYTITGLLKPARMAQLSKTAELVEDAADRLHALQGQVMHSILERAGKALKAEGFVVEERFYLDYEVDGKLYIISAQVDIFDPRLGVLSDYKYTSVAASKHGLKEDHRLQLNFQAEALRRGYVGVGAGLKHVPKYTVNKAEVVLLLRDWSKERIYTGYPESPAVKQTVELMTSEEVTKWVHERIRAHEAAQSNLPLCTDAERWNRPTYAVMKDEAAVKATRVFDTRDAAQAFITAQGKGVLSVRPGEDIRCLRYCPARSVCDQAKRQEPTPPIVGEDGMFKVT